jgi:hypothetical protein
MQPRRSCRLCVLPARLLLEELHKHKEQHVRAEEMAAEARHEDTIEEGMLVPERGMNVLKDINISLQTPSRQPLRVSILQVYSASSVTPSANICIAIIQYFKKAAARLAPFRRRISLSSFSVGSSNLLCLLGLLRSPLLRRSTPTLGIAHEVPPPEAARVVPNEFLMVNVVMIGTGPEG